MIFNKEVLDKIMLNEFGFDSSDLGYSYGKIEIYFCVGLNSLANWFLENNKDSIFVIPNFYAMSKELGVNWKTLMKVFEKNKDILGVKRVNRKDVMSKLKGFNLYQSTFYVIDEKMELTYRSHNGRKVFHRNDWEFFKTKQYLDFLRKKWKWPEWEMKEYLKNNIPNYEKK